MNTTSLLKGYQEKFGADAEKVFFSPGRINLIGEHTDYNGGNVFPCAISLGTYAAFGNRDDQTIQMYSKNLPDKGVISFSLNDLKYDKNDDWANYPKGMIYFITQAGYKIDHGFNLYIHGNLPDGAGLSSSASIELLMGTILKNVFSLDIDQVDLVKMGQKDENDFIGVNSGIMDQFAVGMGKENQAILLDTNTMEYHYAPVKLGDNVIVIMNTNKHRTLADSKYNERRSQCEEALKLLQTKLDIKSLGELSIDEFDRNSYLIDDDILIRRARHAVFENQRTLKAINYLKENNLIEFGKLVNASHISLHYDYEVTGKELDTLVAAAWKQDGVLGARMVGAGFGGCAIAIVNKDKVDDFKQNVGQIYQEKIGYAADFYIAQIADGPKEIALNEVEK
ncbi:galactokinase [Companilactobacillus alimentarius]|uniref:Galactokinase n=1 Tax=Companilactobacillus alimentarius DSM 20249 TaxID=1423720 RepID=A0A2K9HGM3_9LACO|nr:galactokinase [Companilactobacillus alimentarius]AUI71691.1 galactokinase [Companilactobacillus alimentarius DSM 20249]KRK78294.1 galactokinase [Companilactobacillus alimentarius DSM 20249]MDT6953317.1 galactokinase [Companilactobacillus alimentarius]GEO44566.1 galactokinase [Companilactobacillus alimentarius]